MTDIVLLKNRLLSLSVFRDVLDDGVVQALLRYLHKADMGKNAVAEYCEFVSTLYSEACGNLSVHVRKLCFNSENVYVRMCGNKQTPPDVIVSATAHDVETLSYLAGFSCERLTAALERKDLPRYDVEAFDLKNEFYERCRNIGIYGYGKYAAYSAFCIGENGEIESVKHPDGIRLNDFTDYEAERSAVIANTRALLNGKPAANVLLTGDAGTGKSSTVKAIANEFSAEGLRLVEIRKSQLKFIPRILDELAGNPLKFILFIDDISFVSNDDGFNALKAVLEGTVSARSSNVVVYATSNRRHMIKEKFSDREGDEIHANDAVQEAVSLESRFGLHVSFYRPDKKTYLKIVYSLAAAAGITADKQSLANGAERYALERGGRSARLARQFIDGLIAESGQP